MVSKKSIREEWSREGGLEIIHRSEHSRVEQYKYRYLAIVVASVCRYNR